MNMRTIKILIISLLFICIAVFSTQSFLVSAIDNSTTKMESNEYLSSSNLVAHACGEYNGKIYTNSLNSLESNYKKGFRFFEVDFNLSSDNKIVMIHDWGFTAKKIFGKSGKYTHKKFIGTKLKNNMTLLDIDLLIKWLKSHKDANIVTDCKNNSEYILKSISTKYPDMVQRFYIQMGHFNEYETLQKLGYKNIILALYKTNYSDADILNFLSKHKVYAVSMGIKRAETNLPNKLKKINIKVFAHSVNSIVKYRQLLGNGVYGIYTDSISPKKK